jgi:hypothetical protein
MPVNPVVTVILRMFGTSKMRGDAATRVFEGSASKNAPFADSDRGVTITLMMETYGALTGRTGD